jgi:DNA-binding transcriptional MerR regulator
MSKKWYNLFVSVDESAGHPDGGRPEGEGAAPQLNAAQAVADIARSAGPPPTFNAPVNDPGSFTEIYQAAEIQSPPHGFTIEKVAQMLGSEHIRSLPRDVKRSSVLVALDAVGVPIQDVIQDAVKRDQALDTFERVQEQALTQLQAQIDKENQQHQAEIDRVMADYRSRIQANNDKLAKEKERFYDWRLKKQEEEQKIADAVSYFVAENPITTGGHAATPASTPKPE